VSQILKVLTVRFRENFKSRRMRWAGYVACMGDRRGAYKVLMGKRPLARPRHRWEDNIKMDI